LENQGLLLHENDNVGTALADLKAKSTVSVGGGKPLTVEIKEDIPYGFKFSLSLIKQGEPILKYGEVIGRATVDIEPGCLVHVHNVEGQRARGDLQ